VATDFYEIVDPRYLTRLQTVEILDEGDAPPQEFGYALGYNRAEPVGVLFSRPGDRIKMVLSAGVIGVRMLLLNVAPSGEGGKATGAGYLIDRPGAFLRTGLLAAEDMWRLNEARISELKRYNIENRRIQFLHEAARQHVDRARSALEERRWEAFVRHTRSGLGMESRVYPDVRATQTDVIKGVVFFMMLILPCAFFAERLLFAAAGIRRQLAGTTGIFVFLWLILSQIHPAFQLSSPLVILLGFLITALALLVMNLIVSRFNDEMRLIQTNVATVYQTDVSRTGASYVAFMLGIANMRKRRLRTGLTLTTLTLLTFTVLSFTSVQSVLSFVRAKRDYPGPYEGILIRSQAWQPLEEILYSYAETAFEDAQVVPRSWYPEKASALLIGRKEMQARAKGAVGLTPEEAEVTAPHRALVGGRWFTQGDVDACVLPLPIAEQLQIPVSTVGDGSQDVEVDMFGRICRVIGVFDPERLERTRDLDNEPLTPADFAAVGGREGLIGTEQRQQQGLEQPNPEVKEFVHTDPGQVILLPYRRVRELGGELRSVAIRFTETGDLRGRVEELLSRLAVTLFAGIREGENGPIHVFVYNSLGVSSLRGLAHLSIPVVIAALIVLNTMMGSVYERFREIGIYSSVGLAPTHIAFLFLSEACVYAVLGVVAGYLLGQGTAKVLLWGGWLHGFTLNYSSLSTVFVSAVVMGVVLLSALYPAKKAAQMAVPDVNRQWRLPLPEGDGWDFDFPFTVGEREALGLCAFLADYFESYSEESIGIFYTRDVEVVSFETGLGTGYVVGMAIWIAPFDLGVSQRVRLDMTPMDVHRVYQIHLEIDRLSGEFSSWERANRRFVSLLRKQFLIWRTVPEVVREDYRWRGQGILAK
jgi:hypothetical protein